MQILSSYIQHQERFTNLPIQLVGHAETNPSHCLLPGCDARLPFQKSLKSMNRNYMESNLFVLLWNRLCFNLSCFIFIHTGDKLYKCEKCEKAFTQKFRLKVHIAKHTGDRPFLCLKCGKNFTTRQHLPKHNRLHTSSKF